MHKAIPLSPGMHSVNAYLNVRNAAAAIEFYKKAFGATERNRMSMPDGKVGHVELAIGDSVFMIADEIEGWDNKAPETLGGTSGSFLLYVDDVDAVFANAIAAGAKAHPGMPAVVDMFYGDRTGTIIDPSGQKWQIATHFEDLSQEEMQKRMDEMMSKRK